MITAKEQAMYLYLLFYQEIGGIFFKKSRAKRCAIACAKEMIQANMYPFDSKKIDYWIEVCEEIDMIK